jgi:hypothetical protein
MVATVVVACDRRFGFRRALVRSLRTFVPAGASISLITSKAVPLNGLRAHRREEIDQVAVGIAKRAKTDFPTASSSAPEPRR